MVPMSMHSHLGPNQASDTARLRQRHLAPSVSRLRSHRAGRRGPAGNRHSSRSFGAPKPANHAEALYSGPGDDCASSCSGADCEATSSDDRNPYPDFETFSLRQLRRTKYSPPARQGGKIPNKHGPSHTSSALRHPGGDPNGFRKWLILRRF